MSSRKKIFALAGVLSVIFAAGAQAVGPGSADNSAGNKNKSEDTSAARTGKGVCLRIDDLYSKIDQRMTERKSRIETKVTDRIETRKDKRDQRKERLANFRATMDERRARFYEILGSKAETTQQKKAVSDFKTAVEAAVTAKRNSIDSALLTFWSDLDKLVSSGNTNREEIMNTFRSSVKNAYEKANADCENGTDPKTVRDDLRASLKQARETLQNREKEKFGQSIQALVETRNATIKKAVEGFQAAMDKARTDFEAAWPQAESTDTEE